MTNIVKFPTARPSSDDDLEGLFDDQPDDLIVRCNPERPPPRHLFGPAMTADEAKVAYIALPEDVKVIVSAYMRQFAGYYR